MARQANCARRCLANGGLNLECLTGGVLAWVGRLRLTRLTRTVLKLVWKILERHRIPFFVPRRRCSSKAA